MKNFYPPSDEEKSYSHGDWFNYGRHRKKEIPKYLEYLEAIRSKKPQLPEHHAAILSPDAPQSEDPYIKIRKLMQARSNNKGLITKSNKKRKFSPIGVKKHQQPHSLSLIEIENKRYKNLQDAKNDIQRLSKREINPNEYRRLGPTTMMLETFGVRAEIIYLRKASYYRVRFIGKRKNNIKIKAHVKSNNNSNSAVNTAGSRRLFRVFKVKSR